MDNLSHLNTDSINQTGRSNFSEEFTCLICMKHFKSAKTLNTHNINIKCKENKNKGRLQCNFCNKTFISDGTLNTHLSKSHSEVYINNSMAFSYNGNNFSMNKNVKNIPESFLNGFNISVCDMAECGSTHIYPSCKDSFNEIFETVSKPQFNDFEISIKNFYKKNPAQIIISLININSLKNKFVDISFLLKRQFVDVLVINETKLNTEIDDSNFENTFYHMLRRDRPKNGGGGIMVFIKKSLKIKKVKIDKDFEIISLIFSPNKNKDVSLISCYRPPHLENEDPFLLKLEKIVIEMTTISSETIILGDLNFS